MSSNSMFDKKFQLRWDGIAKRKEDEKEMPPKEEWIWVEGYKGTDKDMKCRGYQFSLNSKYDMPEGEAINLCHSGFHFCLNLPSVFGYYPISDNNRFFKVNALVRKSDYNYVKDSLNNKLAAKSIIFTSELTNSEILIGDTYADYDDTEKDLIRAFGINHVTRLRQVGMLTKLGYSGPFAELIIKEGYFDIAMAVGSQSDLSMDMKVFMIMRIGNTKKNAMFYTSPVVPTISQDTMDALKKVSAQTYGYAGLSDRTLNRKG